MNYLKGSRCYLSGPLEHAETYPFDWRKPLRKALKTRYGMTVFDPSIDPKQKMREEIVSAKEAGDFSRLRTIMKSFVRIDLSCVDRCDILIAGLPYRIPTTGSHHEIINSNNAKKPTIIFCPQGVEKIADWYFGIIRPEFMFSTLDNLINYLDKVDRGEEENNDRWYFIYNLAKLTAFYSEPEDD